jgi:hypothetical protein
VFVWRNAIILGIVFVVIGAAYWYLQGDNVLHLDATGATLLILLGVAMAFVFTVLVRGSREL